MVAVAVGSVIGVAAGGRHGVVVDARAVGDDRTGRQTYAVRIRTTEPDATTDRHTATSTPGAPAAMSPGVALGQPIESAGSRRAEQAAARTPDRLSPGERRVVERLRQRDAQVRQEETAHAAGAGSLAGPISYAYQRGPDGRRYTVGGSVPIHARAVSGDPAEARRIGGRLAAAALAATNPSAADIAAAVRGYGFGAEESIGGSPAGDVRGAAVDRTI